MLNKVMIIGHLGKDPEVTVLQTGVTVAKFSIATTENYKDKQGNKVSNTEWHNVELWEGLAKVAEQYLKKGSLVYVEGKIKTEEYTNKEGQKARTTKIRGTSMTMLGGKTEGQGSDGYQQPAQSSKPDDFKFTEEPEMDDLPF